MKILSQVIKDKLSGIRCFLLDMDGTVYLGSKPIPGAKEFIQCIANQGLQYIFLTNNSSKNSLFYIDKLKSMGIECGMNNIITSTDVLMDYLKKNLPEAVLFPVGTDYFIEDLSKNGFSLVYEYHPEKTNVVDYVTLGFAMNLTYAKISDACRYIQKGVPYLATHPDYTCPIEGGDYIPDCGAMIEFIKAATGVEPEMVMGKPNPLIAEMVLEKNNLNKGEIAIIGDRLYTDIKQGINSKIASVLVLSGETTEEDLQRSDIKPDLTVNNIMDLYQAIEGMS